MKTLDLMSYLKKQCFPPRIRNKAWIPLSLLLFNNVLAREMRQENKRKGKNKTVFFHKNTAIGRQKKLQTESIIKNIQELINEVRKAAG